jgi:hypothetical protein
LAGGFWQPPLVAIDKNSGSWKLVDKNNGNALIGN